MASSSSASSFSLCLRGLRLGTRSEGSSSSSSSSSTLTRCLRGMKEGLETPAVRVSRAREEEADKRPTESRDLARASSKASSALVELDAAIQRPILGPAHRSRLQR